MSARSNSAGRSDPAKRTLKDRASEVEASAARVIKGRRSNQNGDQNPAASMLHGSAANNVDEPFKTSAQASHDTGGGDPGRSKAARGHAPHQESAMGRHESFDPTTSVRTSYAHADAADSDALSPSDVSIGVRALRDRWRATHTAAHAPGLSESEITRLGDLTTAAEKALIAAPIRSAADLACKVEALREHIGINDLGFGSPNEVVLAVCRGVEMLAHMPTAAPDRSTEADDVPGGDLILQAIDDHRATFDAVDAQPTEALADAALVQHERAYKTLKAITPSTSAGICALAAHLRRFLKDGGNQIDNTFAGEAFTVLLNAVERFGAKSTSPFAARPEPHDLSSLSISDLAHLFDNYEAVHEQWLAVSCQPWCRPNRTEPGLAWSFINRESTRNALARDRISDEIRSRSPKDAEERNTLLSIRIKDELLCEGWITDRDLLLEAVKAWG